MAVITKEMKVSEVLKNYPDTLEVFVEASPHFRKLENKILRRALASRVTIQQAAQIAGIDLNEFLFKLNKKINLTIYESKINEQTLEKSMQLKPEIIQNSPEDKIVTLDVRPIIDSGRDPFTNIMEKVKNLKDDEIFLLINSFEPVPLYTVLGNKGFKHYTEKEDDIFKVYFYRTHKTDESITKISSESNPADITNLIEIDVRELPPPEPMVKILESLTSIDEHTALLVHHHREPLMLYSKLEERGFKAITNKISDNYYKVLIIKRR